MVDVCGDVGLLVDQASAVVACCAAETVGVELRKHHEHRCVRMVKCHPRSQVDLVLVATRGSGVSNRLLTPDHPSWSPDLDQGLYAVQGVYNLLWSRLHSAVRAAAACCCVLH